MHRGGVAQIAGLPASGAGLGWGLGALGSGFGLELDLGPRRGGACMGGLMHRRAKEDYHALIPCHVAMHLTCVSCSHASNMHFMCPHMTPLTMQTPCSPMIPMHCMHWCMHWYDIYAAQRYLAQAARNDTWHRQLAMIPGTGSSQ